MPLARPTLDQLITRTEQDLASRFGVGRLIPRGPLAALARVIAYATHGELGALDQEVLNVFPDTCDAANLDRWGALLTLPRKAATTATGGVVFAGTNGTSIAAGTVVVRADGERFTTTEATTVVNGAATAPVQAVVPGVAGNTAGATPMSMGSSVVGTVNSVAVDSAGLSGGADLEEDDDFRRRIVQRWSNPPGAGTVADYERWALEVAGVTRAWPLPGNQGPGTVGLVFVVDDDPVSIIPTATKVAEVQAHLDVRKPAEVSLLVFAPVAVPINFTIHVVPDTADVRAAVAQSLEDLLEREGAPASTIPLSHVREAISLAPGETDHALTAPATDLVIGAGDIPTVGTITWN